MSSHTNEKEATALLGDAIVKIVGEPICDSKFLKGYNTYSHPETRDIVASCCGVVEVVERVVSVRGLDPKYIPEVGDVVVGRITEVSGNRWRCDVGAHQPAIMLLANVTEPGGLLRRRGRDDELSMRDLFQDEDIFAAEVQRIMHDGTISLHTRSAQKYGKLTGIGQFVSVRPCLVQRVPHHFFTIDTLSTCVILGKNGGVWLYPNIPHVANKEQEEGEGETGNQQQWSKVMEGRPANEQATESKKRKSGENREEDDADDDHAEAKSPWEMRRNIAIVRNALCVLDQASLAISPLTIEVACKCVWQNNIRPHEMSLPANRESIVTAVTAQRTVHRRKRHHD